MGPQLLVQVLGWESPGNASWSYKDLGEVAAYKLQWPHWQMVVFVKVSCCSLNPMAGEGLLLSWKSCLELETQEGSLTTDACKLLWSQ